MLSKIDRIGNVPNINMELNKLMRFYIFNLLVKNGIKIGATDLLYVLFYLAY